jgi:SAM-dependent methyltransferase
MPKAAQYLPDASSVSGDHGVSVDVRQCSVCALVQLDGDPVPYYREVIRATAFSDAMRAFRRTQLSQFAAQHGLAGKKTLEVGCGRGEYLSLLSELGIAATGVEWSAASVAAAAQRGLKVFRRFLSRPGRPLPDAPYDAFLFFSFLEHLPDPVAALRAIRQNLSASAVGLVEVPNFDMILANDLFGEFIGDHLLYFTRETLTATLGRAGFTVVSCDAIWHRYILSATVRNREPLDLSRFDARRERLAQELRRFVTSVGAGRVAVWGAGHQAFAVLALSGIAPDIRYVIDSAPFKQGSFTPATHLPIVPPDRLEIDPVDGIVVMAAGYSDEVAAAIRARYPGRLRVAILREHGLEIPDVESGSTILRGDS